MADESKKEHPEDIQSILSDLDAILTDMGGDAPAALKPEVPAEPPKPVEAPKAAVPPPPPAPVAAPKPVEVPKAAPPPPPPAPVAPPKSNQVELAPREGIIKPPEKKPEPPKPAPKLPDQKPIELFAGPATPPPAPVPPAASPAPVVPPPPPVVKAPEPVKPPEPVKAPEPVKPPEPAKAAAPVEPVKAPSAPTAVPAPGHVVASTKIEELPADTPKEQIRRVAYIHTAACAEVKGAFGDFLSKAARTISKKPLFLREVLSHEVGAASDPNAILQKALQVKAVAILAVVDGWPSAKVDELSEACSRSNMLFRSVAPADAQKKSTAVDVIVDMMLLPGEG